MEYFDLRKDKMAAYADKANDVYDKESPEAQWYYDTRAKLEYGLRLLSKELETNFKVTFKPGANKLGGQAKPQNFKDYILLGFIPAYLEEMIFEKDIFVKLCFHSFTKEGKATLAVELDTFFMNKENPYDKDRVHGLHSYQIPVDETFPKNWEEWVELVKPKVEKKIKELEQLVYSKQNKAEDVKDLRRPEAEKTPLNHILYGPPGTGKTYRLQKQYIPLFKREVATRNREEFEGQEIANLSWWQVIALVLLEKGVATVPEIKEHRFIAYKRKASNTKTLDSTLWGQLMLHAIPESETIGSDRRLSPTLFDKKIEDKKSLWHIVEERKEVVQDLADLREELEAFQPQSKYKSNHSFTTFHQAFSYEDFIEGIKPVLQDADEEEQTDLQYRIEKGLFYQCCEAAAKLAGFLNLKDCIDNYDKEQRKERFEHAPRYALFIDEINRGNVAAILGELITLIEDGKRLGQEEEQIVQLPYSKTAFGVPANLHIIGTMNTADRSVEALDTALRRRFTFEEVGPNLQALAQKDKEQPLSIGGSPILRKELLHCINQRIEVLLDRDHCIGHSYFLKVENEADLKKAFAQNILPLLQEYFYGDYGKIALVVGEGFCRPRQMRNSDMLFADVTEYDAQAYSQKQQYELPLQEPGFDLEQALLRLLKRPVGNKEEA